MPKIFQILQFRKILIWKIKKISNSENFKNFVSINFQNFPKLYNFKNHQISEIVQLIYKFQLISINFEFYNRSYILSVQVI